MDFKKYTDIYATRITLDTDDNSLVSKRLPKHYIEIIDVKDIGNEGELFIKEVYYTVYTNISYDQLVNKMVKERYSDSEEFAILRKAINNGISDEYTAYNTYVEECKAQAKEFIAKRDKALS